MGRPLEKPFSESIANQPADSHDPRVWAGIILPPRSTKGSEEEFSLAERVPEASDINENMYTPTATRDSSPNLSPTRFFQVPTRSVVKESRSKETYLFTSSFQTSLSQGFLKLNVIVFPPSFNYRCLGKSMRLFENESSLSHRSRYQPE